MLITPYQEIEDRPVKPTTTPLGAVLIPTNENVWDEVN